MSRNRENWIIALNPEVSLAPNQPIGTCVYKDLEERICIEIIWDNDFVFKERSTLLITSDKKTCTPTIYVADKFVNLLCEKEYSNAGLWHEIGHIHCGHFDLNIDQEEQRRGRYEALFNGKVYYPEAEADAFAAKQVGKNRMIQFLQFCKVNRMDYNDANSDLALKDFDLRINNIKRLKL